MIILLAMISRTREVPALLTGERIRGLFLPVARMVAVIPVVFIVIAAILIGKIQFIYDGPYHTASNVFDISA
jgi:hypothetical protein